MTLDGVVAHGRGVLLEVAHVRIDERGLFLVGEGIEGNAAGFCWYKVVDSEGVVGAVSVVHGPVWVVGEGLGSDGRRVL